MIKKESVNQQKWQKLLKTQTGGVKIEKYEKLGSRIKIAKIKEKLKNGAKKDCHKYKLGARRAMRYHRTHEYLNLCDK